MMPLLYRLRRRVALFVCPELSAESRLKATLAEARAMRAPAGFMDLGLAIFARTERAPFSDFMGALVTVHFRQERPPFSASYRETARLAQHFGWAIPAQKAARRWIAPKRMLRSVIPHWDRDHAFEAAVREFAQKSIGREQIDDVEPFFAGKHRLHRRLPSPWP